MIVMITVFLICWGPYAALCLVGLLGYAQVNGGQSVVVVARRSSYPRVVSHILRHPAQTSSFTNISPAKFLKNFCRWKIMIGLS